MEEIYADRLVEELDKLGYTSKLSSYGKVVIAKLGGKVYVSVQIGEGNVRIIVSALSPRDISGKAITRKKVILLDDYTVERDIAEEVDKLVKSILQDFDELNNKFIKELSELLKKDGYAVDVDLQKIRVYRKGKEIGFIQIDRFGWITLRVFGRDIRLLPDNDPKTILYLMRSIQNS